jgi:hypothetical protein
LQASISDTGDNMRQGEAINNPTEKKKRNRDGAYNQKWDEMIGCAQRQPVACY